MKDPEDPLGEEMTKEARVWKTFIIESLGDLKPDPTESSARSLLVISQKLDSILAGQQALSLPAQGTSLDDFSPSHSAVIVNILWLLSLSLSVAVSLIAMLAKGWCYRFMIGRSGAIYEQARKRQMKWDGIERWRMREVLDHLPGVMHSALALFAIGLCIYLWNINIRVAIPVTAVTAMAGFVYLFTAVLPYLDHFCPYNTPASTLVTLILEYVVFVASWLILIVPDLLGQEDWVQSQVNWLIPFLPDFIRREYTDEEGETIYAHMDVVTSRMLAWILVNSEDPRSVDISLQALAGARSKLPCPPLAKARALNLVYTRLRSCTFRDRVTRKDHLKDSAMFQTALRYSRSYDVLLCDSGRRNISDALKYRNYGEKGFTDIPDHLFLPGIGLDASLLEDTENMSMDASTMLFALIGPVLRVEWNYQGIASKEVEQATAILRSHAFSEWPTVSDSALIAFLDSCSQVLVESWSKSENTGEGELPAILVSIFLKARDSAPDVAHVVAIILAAAAFTLNIYPGGEEPTTSKSDQERRAAQVLHHYRIGQSNKKINDKLFYFALFGLIPHIDLHVHQTQMPVVTELSRVLREMDRYSKLGLYTLPASYCSATHRTASYTTFLDRMTDNSITSSNRLDMISIYVSAAKDRWGKFEHEIFIPLLVALSFEQTEELQNAYHRILESLSLQVNPMNDLTLLSTRNLLPRLFKSIPNSNNHVTPIMVFYFRLLVGFVILDFGTPLLERQSSCQKIIFSWLELNPYLTPTTGDRLFPPEDRILEHVVEGVSRPLEWDDMRSTMQLIVDFCHADPRRCPYAMPPLTRLLRINEAKAKFDAAYMRPTQKTPSTSLEVGNPCWELPKHEDVQEEGN
ncbi:transmembrane protein [Ceratobasidium sp. AG-Ba]|nr:transmembrane protein [Ceratobasidium sp. AG-Ba]